MKSLSSVQPFVTTWTVAYQASASMGFSRQEYWSGLPFPSPGADVLTSEPPPYDPSIPLLGIYPEETKIEKETCTPLFTAALFTIARTRKQFRRPSTDEWLKKLGYIYTMEYYSAIKRGAFESVLMRWMNLEPIIHTEVSQKKKDKYRILMHI